MGRSSQLSLGIERRPRTWGGKRRGAGRPRGGPRRLGPHRRREAFDRAAAVHVTLRMADRVYNLRSRRSARALAPALWAGADRFDVRVVQLSVQGNHLHLLVEAPDAKALGRAMKGLGVRIARRLNRMMGHGGQVIGDRYHARRLRTPTEVRSVMHYIRYNHQHHAISRAVLDEYSSDVAFADVVTAPRIWVLMVGWQRGRVGKVPDPAG